MSGEDEFMKQLQGSGAANALTMCFFFLFWVVKSKCKHCRCEGHSFCSDCSVNDDDSEEKQDLERGEGGRISAKVEEEMLKLLQSKYPGLLSKRTATISID